MVCDNGLCHKNTQKANVLRFLVESWMEGGLCVAEAQAKRLGKGRGVIGSRMRALWRKRSLPFR